MKGKRLYRSSDDRMLCGVCAGIAEYFEIDPTLIRLAWVFCCCFGVFPAIIAYRVYHRRGCDPDSAFHSVSPQTRGCAHL